MHKIFLFLFFTSLFHLNKLFAQEYTITRNWIGSQSESIVDLTQKSNGNYYALFKFNQTLQIIDSTFNSNGSFDLAIAEYDNSNQLLNIKHIKSNDNISFIDLCLDDNEQAYLLLSADDNIQFNGQNLACNSNGYNSLIALDDNLDLRWNYCIQSNNYLQLECLHFNQTLFLGGAFRGELISSDFQIQSNSQSTPVLIELNTNAQFINIETLLNSRNATIKDVTSSTNGNLFISGHFQDTIRIGQVDYHTNTTEYDIFVAKREGNTWTEHKVYFGLADDYAHMIHFNPNNNQLYLTGTLNSQLQLPQQLLATAFPQDNAFIIQLNTDLTEQWALQSLSDFKNEPLDIVYYNQQLFLLLQLDGISYIDNQTINQQNYTSNALLNINENGSVHNIEAIYNPNGPIYTEAGIALNNNQLRFGGTFTQSWSSNNFNVPNNGSFDAFIGSQNLSISLSNKQQKFSNINIFPNPCSDFLNIQQNGKQYKWKIINVLGIVCMHGSGNQINCNRLPKGVYWLQLFDDQLVSKSFSFIRE